MKKVKIWQVVGVILVGSFAVKQTKKFIMRHFDKDKDGVIDIFDDVVEVEGFENEEKTNQKGE